MASPLPNTNAPAFVKNSRIWSSSWSLAVASAVRSVCSRSAIAPAVAAAIELNRMVRGHPGHARTRVSTSPAAMNNAANSAPDHAVATNSAVNTPHSSRSCLLVPRASR